MHLCFHKKVHPLRVPRELGQVPAVPAAQPRLQADLHQVLCLPLQLHFRALAQLKVREPVQSGCAHQCAAL